MGAYLGSPHQRRVFLHGSLRISLLNLMGLPGKVKNFTRSGRNASFKGSVRHIAKNRQFKNLSFLMLAKCAIREFNQGAFSFLFVVPSGGQRWGFCLWQAAKRELRGAGARFSAVFGLPLRASEVWDQVRSELHGKSSCTGRQSAPEAPFHSYRRN